MGLFSRKATAINHKELVEDKVVINRMIRAYISKSLDSMSEVGDFIIKYFLALYLMHQQLHSLLHCLVHYQLQSLFLSLLMPSLAFPQLQ